MSGTTQQKRVPGCLFIENYQKSFELVKSRGGSNFLESFSLSEYLPPVADQGTFGTCVSWATTYYGMTILDNIRNNKKDSHSLSSYFSPMLTHDLSRIRLDSCEEGTYIPRALDVLKYFGATNIDYYGLECRDGLEDIYYNDIMSYNDRSEKEIEKIFKSARNNRLSGYNYLGKYDLINKVKYFLNEKMPIIISVKQYNSIEESNFVGKDTWNGVIENDYSYGGHALCVIGYDDNKLGGAVQIINSWGTDWGSNGFFWIRYADFEKVVKGAYAMNGISQLNESKVINDFDLEITFVGKNSKLMEIENKFVFYQDLQFVRGGFPAKKYKILYDSTSKEEYRFAINSKKDVYFYYITNEEDQYYGSKLVLNYPVGHSSSNFLDSNNSGVILPESSYDFYEIPKSRDSYIVFLFSTQKLEIDELNLKLSTYKNINPFLENTFLDDLILSQPNEKIKGWNNELLCLGVSNDPNSVFPVVFYFEEIKKSPIYIKRKWWQRKNKNEFDIDWFLE